MRTASTSTKTSALDQIVDWSTEKPDWQRDALRRIIANEELGEDALNALERISRQKHGADASTDPAPKAKPVSEGDIPKASAVDDAVSLVSVGKLQNVNRIPSDQTLTLGAAPGLTIVYGDNGYGKSGYSRVIKKACRSRGSAPAIRPNAFAPKPKGPATAEISFIHAGTTQTITWTDGVAADSRLSHIFVFDSVSAMNYLDEDAPASFTPRGLDVLPKLSKLCDHLKGRFNQEKGRLVQENSTASAGWRLRPVTAAGKLMNGLRADTPAANVEALATVTFEEQRRFDDLTDALKSNPKQKARETRASASRLRTLADSLKARAATISDSVIAEARELLAETKAAEEKAKLFAETSFKDGYATGTGGPIWRALWDAAREFSSVALPEEVFPASGKDAFCLLCQQKLDESAKKRLEAFERFCKDKTRQTADELANKLAAKTKVILAMQSLTPSFTTAEADITGSEGDLATATAEYVKKSDARLTRLAENMRSGAWTAPPALCESTETRIRGKVVALEERAKTEEAVEDPIKRATLQAEHDELSDRKAMGVIKAQVLDNIRRLKRIAALDNCMQDCSTYAATALNKDLADRLITDAFRKQFDEEVKAIGLKTLRVQLADTGGQKGNARFGLRLVDAKDHKVRDVASEGEQRCVALASFLAELSVASNHSALVFDDPVSSLDHGYCDRIAQRLAAEAKLRQVIVFTHNVVFLHDLSDAAQRLGMKPALRFLEWDSSGPGICAEGLPWEHQKPEQRLDLLEKRLRGIEKGWGPHPTEDQKREMRSIYSELRATLERIVERVLLADVVFRFRNFINLKRLHEVAGIPDSECNEIGRLHQKCCNVTEAHDPSGATHIPDPAQLQKDIEDTKNLLETIRVRQKPKPKK